ncbi:uncharacterized protein DDB_G0271670 [Rhipicephalus sanguineus]|uniref:uncharacterized protein DDB_G0271670 n=1 Tax=Rhipicephalus sanguineus TaxID=34632 RepID=UPI0020C322B5|nr:uncharacterized protein DDB_G0271670 [Rhipicephalus sanguineus]
MSRLMSEFAHLWPVSRGVKEGTFFSAPSSDSSSHRAHSGGAAAVVGFSFAVRIVYFQHGRVSFSSAASLRRSRSDGGGDTSSDEEEYDEVSGATLADGVSSRAMANGVCRRNASDVEDDDDDEDDDEDDEEVRDLTWSGRVGGGVGVGEGVMNGVHGSASSAASSARSSSQRSSSSSSTAVVPPTPVEFRASPPLHVHRPYNGSPPPKVFHAAPGVVGGTSSSSSTSSSSTSSGPTTLTLSASAHIPAFEVCAVSPRKRHRQDRGGGGTAFGVFSLVDGGPVQRPCLDFEKMQQVSGTVRH